MDPNANLAGQRRLVASLREQVYSDMPPSHQDIRRLLELVEALDEWITKGGFLPKDWERK